MSNSLAVATVTASLKNILQSAFNSNLPDNPGGSEVTTQSPADRGATRGANIFLYQTSPNAALRNQALPSRNSDGATIQPPQAALDLHYIISFYGDDLALEPQRLLGIAVRTLNAQPVLSRRIVSQTVQSAATPGSGAEFLGNSDLADGPAVVRLTQSEISLEELSKLWSILLQTKYALSVLYVASVVLIDSPEPGVTALPVMERHLSINPLRALSIDQVAASDGGPILTGETIAVVGTGLSTPGLVVSIDGALQAVSFGLALGNRLEFALPSALRAGAHALRLSAFPNGSPLPAYESNLATFLLRPSIDGTIAKSGIAANAQGLFNGSLSVPVSPRVGKSQRVSLLLNRKGPPAAPASPPASPPIAQPPAGVVLSLHPAPDDTSDTAALVFPFAGVAGGVYAARLRVDGVESPVVVSLSPPAATLGPEVVIP